MTEKISWDLRKICEKLTENHSEIEEIYLFGSRAYKTGSLRSDIDLLAMCSRNIPITSITGWLAEMFPPVDLFLSSDGKNAFSVINGSCLEKRGEESLVEQIDAIKLWKKGEGIDDTFNDWVQETDRKTDFQMSIIPGPLVEDLDRSINKVMAELESKNIKTYFAGKNWDEISESIIGIIEKAFIKPSKYSKRAQNFSYDTIKLKDEYDFQNLIHLLLRPIFPSIEPENLVITIDGSKKNADFGILDNGVIIEAKFIKDTSSKSAIIKTLRGLADFYKYNPNVKSLIFFVLYNPDVVLDEVNLNDRFSRAYDPVPIHVRFIKNIFK